MKVIFPAIWITGFAVATIAMFVSPDSFNGQGSDVSAANLKWVFLAAAVVGATFIYWGCIRLKRVELDGDSLIVSNYLREVRIPLRQIEDVTENRWVNIHPVTIHFRDETAFGPSIVFMPKVRWFGFWSSHPVVGDLLLAAERASSRQSLSPAG